MPRMHDGRVDRFRLPPVLALLSLALLACHGTDVRAGLEEARRLREAGRPEEAARVLELLVARVPDDPVVLYEQALALHAAGHDEDALKPITAALARAPASLDTKVLHGTILGAVGREEEGLAELRQVAQADPKRGGVHRAMALILARAGRHGPAVNQFEKELAQNPDDVDTLTDLGVFYFQTAQPDQAADRLRRAASLPNASARAHRWYGEVLIRSLKIPEGLEEQRLALAQEPDNIDLLVTHAHALQAYGHPEEARRLVRAAIDRGLADPRLHVELGREAREALDYAEAAAEYSKAIAIDSSLAEAQLELGKVYLFTGKRAEARAAFDAAHRLAPTDPYSPYYLASFQVEEGNFDEAIRLLKRSLELDPLNPKAHYALAQALQRAGRGAEAQAELTRHAEILERLRGQKDTAGPATME
jgi:tetratricopeptide (TPR) repeat protein